MEVAKRAGEQADSEYGDRLRRMRNNVNEANERINQVDGRMTDHIGVMNGEVPPPVEGGDKAAAAVGLLGELESAITTLQYRVASLECTAGAALQMSM